MENWKSGNAHLFFHRSRTDGAKAVSKISDASCAYGSSRVAIVSGSEATVDSQKTFLSVRLQSDEKTKTEKESCTAAAPTGSQCLVLFHMWYDNHWRLFFSADVPLSSSRHLPKSICIYLLLGSIILLTFIICTYEALDRTSTNNTTDEQVTLAHTITTRQKEHALSVLAVNASCH